MSAEKALTKVTASAVPCKIRPREIRKRKPQISPLRCALSKNIPTKGPRNRRSLGFARDDKGRGNGSIESSCRTEAFFITLGGPQAHDHSGYKGEVRDWDRSLIIDPKRTTARKLGLPIVPSTHFQGRYP